MKRKLTPTLTLWDAAKVTGHGSMWNWWHSCVARFRNLTEKTSGAGLAKQGLVVSDIESQFPKTKVNIDMLLTSYTVAIRPTPRQKTVLKNILRISNAAYNWCLWLVRERDVKPSLFDLQKIVCRAKLTDVPDNFRGPDTDFIFSDILPSKLTTVRLTACKTFVTHYKAAKKKTKNRARFKTKEIDDPVEGSFCVQKLYTRPVKEKDFRHDPARWQQKYISLLPDAFGRVANPTERYLLLSKSIDRIPPIDHDFWVTLRPDGRFVLRIPCDSKYTRVQKGRTSNGAMCGVDPGSRAFVTVFDETRREAWQVGTIEDKRDVMVPIHKSIDEQSKRLTKAIERKHQQEIKDRKKAIKRLWFRLKNRIDAIHAAVASHLVRHFDLVALGKINVSSIVKKKDETSRELPKCVKRHLLAWRHYSFRLRLQHRAQGTPCLVIVQNESYTSKTCGLCKAVNRNLGSSETFECDKCKYVVHRDINGARNILQKALNIF